MTEPLTTVPTADVQANALWQVLSDCPRSTGGVFLDPAARARLDRAVAQYFGLSIHVATAQVRPFLAPAIVGGRTLILYDTQRVPLVNLLHWLAGRNAR